MLRDYLFDFGDSLLRSASVLTLIKDTSRLHYPDWRVALITLSGVPSLQIRKAVHNGSRFDVWLKRVYHYWLCDPRLRLLFYIVFLPAAATTIFFRYVAPSPPTLDTLPWYQKNHRLFVAYYAAGVGDRHRRFCRPGRC